MPSGRYVVMDGDGNPVGTEEFRCAPGPAGWRYFSEIQTGLPERHDEIVDLVVDAEWHPVRVRIATGSHEIELTASERSLTGWLDGEPAVLPWGRQMHIDYLSPAFNAVTANRLDASAEIDVVYLAPVSCEPTVQRQRYELIGDDETATPVGRFQTRRWRYTTLDSGWTADLWVAGDVVVAYEGLFELESYEPGASGPSPLG
jgi:hypothetical protein